LKWQTGTRFWEIFDLGKMRGTHAIRAYINSATKTIGRFAAEPD